MLPGDNSHKKDEAEEPKLSKVVSGASARRKSATNLAMSLLHPGPPLRPHMSEQGLERRATNTGAEEHNGPKPTLRRPESVYSHGGRPPPTSEGTRGLYR